MGTLDFALRLLAAIGAGFIIGFEREWRSKSAGLRTISLVTIGAALYVLLSIMITDAKGGDVSRIIGQVVTGIGFLGGGIIFKEGVSVRGLTTAATVWCSSAIGALAAGGFFYETLLGTLAILAVNIILIPMNDFIHTLRNKQAEKHHSDAENEWYMPKRSIQTLSDYAPRPQSHRWIKIGKKFPDVYNYWYLCLRNRLSEGLAKSASALRVFNYIY